MKNLEQNEVKNLIDMLREFYYERNGKKNTIEFLEYITKEIKKTEEQDWIEIYK